MENTNKNPKSQSHFFSKFLKDLKQSGKQRSWKKNRDLSLFVSGAYELTEGLQKYGELIASCGKTLKFGACSHEEHGKKLIQGNFCKARLCVTCQWRKSLVIRKQILDLVKGHLEKHSTDVPLLLTLTVVNVPGNKLSKTIDEMSDGWRRLMQRKTVAQSVRSNFRSLEITYNKERDDYHPHFHALLMVPKEYFEKNSSFYITHEEWLRLWKLSMRDDRITQVDIRIVKARKEGELESMVAEVAKYATKPSSYITVNSNGEPSVNPKVIEELHYALKGRRLVGFGGVFKKVREEKKMMDVEKANLNDIIDDDSGEEVYEEGSSKVNVEVCKICGEPLVEEVYAWNFKVRNYLRVSPVDPPI